MFTSKVSPLKAAAPIDAQLVASHTETHDMKSALAVCYAHAYSKLQTLLDDALYASQLGVSYHAADNIKQHSASGCGSATTVTKIIISSHECFSDLHEQSSAFFSGEADLARISSAAADVFASREIPVDRCLGDGVAHLLGTFTTPTGWVSPDVWGYRYAAVYAAVRSDISLWTEQLLTSRSASLANNTNVARIRKSFSALCAALQAVDEAYRNGQGWRAFKHSRETEPSSMLYRLFQPLVADALMRLAISINAQFRPDSRLMSHARSLSNCPAENANYVVLAVLSTVHSLMDLLTAMFVTQELMIMDGPMASSLALSMLKSAFVTRIASIDLERF